MRRKRIEPQDSDFLPHADTVAGLDRRTKQPILLTSNGQPFVPTAARNGGQGSGLGHGQNNGQDNSGTHLADAGEFGSLSVPRGDRLLAYQKSVQNRPTNDRADDHEALELARFSSLDSESSAGLTDNVTVDISEGYRNKKMSESSGTFCSDNFLSLELQNTPLERIPNISTTQLMRLLHHPDPSYVESARRTLIGRENFQEAHMKLAWRLYHPVPAVRQEIMDMLPHTPNVQPVVWLTVLLGDPSDDVRYRTASFLATTNDPALRRLLIDRGRRDSDARIVHLAERLDESQRGNVRRY
jgi:hypothetical protein